MANRNSTFLIKRSNIIGKVPNLTGLTIGELALNTADAKLYTIFTSGTTGGTEVRQIGWDRVSRTGDTVYGDFNFYGNIQISGLTQPSGYTLSITGDTNLIGYSFHSGNTEQIGNHHITGNTSQEGIYTHSGNTFITGDTAQIGDFNLSGDAFIQSGVTASSYNISVIPTLNNTLFQILGRNENTGEVEYRQVNTVGNNITIITGGTYSAVTTVDNVIGVDTTLSTTTIYLPDSVSSGRLRFEIKDIGLNAFYNPITIIASGSDTIISYINTQTLIMESEGGAIILLNTGLGQWWQM